MKNMINKIFILDDNKEYLVIRQAIYKNKNYYVSVLIENNNLIPKAFLFEETIENNKEYLEIVKDNKVKNIILKYLGLKK